MRKRRIYTDTSVIGGCLDDEFSAYSKRLFQRFTTGSDVLVISDLTRLELERAADAVRSILDELPQAGIEEVRLTPEASELAEQYLAARVKDREVFLTLSILRQQPFIGLTCW